jgi:predicted membrane metal-binding protein
MFVSVLIQHSLRGGGGVEAIQLSLVVGGVRGHLPAAHLCCRVLLVAAAAAAAEATWQVAWAWQQQQALQLSQSLLEVYQTMKIRTVTVTLHTLYQDQQQQA